MSYLIGLMIAAICAFLTYINLDREKSKKIKLLNIHKENSYNKEIPQVQLCLFSVIVFLGSFVASLSIFASVGNILDIIKMNITLVCLSGASAMDYREHRIPNIYSLILALCGIIFLIIEYFCNQIRAVDYIVSSVIATLGVIVCFSLAAIFTKQGIGLGDIKLLCAIALLGGVYTICGTIFFSMTACAIIAVILLLMKKKNMQSSLPFGPFIFWGYLVTILVSIY